jgi:hypothetical protein
MMLLTPYYNVSKLLPHVGVSIGVVPVGNICVMPPAFDVGVKPAKFP